MSSLVEARKKTDWFIELDTMFLYTISRVDLSKIVRTMKQGNERFLSYGNAPSRWRRDMKINK